MVKQQIYWLIRNYFYYFKDIDDEIYNKRSLNSLGKYLFTIIRKQISGASNKAIKEVVLQLSRKTSIDNYYLEIVQQAGVTKLPKVALTTVKKNYQNVKKQYDNYKRKSISKLKLLDSENSKADLLEISIKKRTHSVPLNKNLTEEFRQLNNINELRERIRTYQEIINFDIEYLSVCWTEEFGQDEELDKRLKEKAKRIFLWEVDKEDNIYHALSMHIKAAESNLQDELTLFYKVKFIPLFDRIFLMNYSKHFRQEMNGEDYDVQEELNAIPNIADMIDKRKNNRKDYLIALKKLFDDFSILSELKNNINKHVHGARKEILMKCLSFFDTNKLDMLINLLPIQIEGLFYDLLVDSTMYQLFSKLDIYTKPTLRKKLDAFHETRHIDIYEYFKFYFNNLIRNVVAHGRADFSDVQNEILAYELLLDFYCQIHYYIQKSEYVRMDLLLQGFYRNYNVDTAFDYEKMNYALMLETLCHDRHISILSYGVERFEPLQSLYWILNPTYEKKYVEIYGYDKLSFVREIICSVKFWEYVNNEIVQCIDYGYGYKKFDKVFDDILNRLLGYLESGKLKEAVVTVKRNLKKLKQIDFEDNERYAVIKTLI